MTPTLSYFGGSSVHGGRIRRLQAATFKQVVENYINIPVQSRLTRQEWENLSIQEKDKQKDGPYLCAATWPFEEGHREDATATHCVLIIIDLDEGDFVKDFYESPQTISEALYPYNYACYTTAKHTAKEPRLKIIVDVKACDPQDHKRIVRFIIRRLGLPDTFKGIRESRTLSLPAYRPMQFKGEDYSAVIGSRTDGLQLDVADTPEELHEDDIERRYAYDGDDSGMLLTHLPVAGISVEDIREPLFAIPSDVEYKHWVGVACSLIHQWGSDEEKSQHAYQIFDEWSARGSKYRGENETYSKWKSFRPYSKTRAPLTIRSLFKLASDNGWENTRVANQVKQGVMDWIKECEDPDVLMAEGAKRIAQMPFKNDIVEEAMIVALRSRLQSLSKTSIDKSIIRREVNNHRYKAKADEKTELESWLRPFCFIGPMNEFRNMSNGVRYAPDAFNNTYSSFLMPSPDDEELAKTGKPLVLPVHHALNVRQIKKVDGVTYDPRFDGEEPFFEYEGKVLLNEYRISTVPKADDTFRDKAKALYLELALAVLGDEEYVQILFDYMAYVIQHPGQKILWAIIIQGAQGVGKNTLMEILACAIGETNMLYLNPSALASDFNSWRTGYQVVVFDELKTPGENRHALVNKTLKDVITNARVTLNKKFADPILVPNLTNYFGLTNWKDCIPLEESDRRFMPIFSPMQTKEQVVNFRATGIFDKVYDMIANNAGAFRAMFLSHPISESFNPKGEAPWTPFRQTLVDSGKSQTRLDLETEIANKVGLQKHFYVPPQFRAPSNLDHNLTAMGFRRMDDGVYTNWNDEDISAEFMWTLVADENTL